MIQDLIFHELTEETAYLLEGADVFDNPVDHDQRAAFYR